MKEFIKKFAPNSLVQLAKISRDIFFISPNFFYDMTRFIKYSSICGNRRSQEKLRAVLTMDYHRLEKGMSLSDPRPGFGWYAAKKMMKNIEFYQINFGHDETLKICLNVINKYRDFNELHGIFNNELSNFINKIKENGIDNFDGDLGGIKEISKKEIFSDSIVDLKPFLWSRYSTRQFSSEEVANELLEKAARLAQKSPSVCNRQSSKIYVLTSKDDQKKILSYQNGNRGFGHQASRILIVTSDLQCFTSIGERYQFWIDGGMFAMSLIYSLHSLGLGTCALNWSVEARADKAMRKAAGIPKSENIIMLIAVGHLPEKFHVAQSTRKPLNQVIFFK